jgi:RNA polymerase subunit RPABC4/transcription elongation factor Spt4
MAEAKIFAKLRNLSYFDIRLGRLEPRGDTYVEKGVDIAIAVDMISMVRFKDIANPTLKKVALNADAIPRLMNWNRAHDRRDVWRREKADTRSHQCHIKNSDRLMICPNCKFIYESGNTCVNCGSPLLPQITTQTEGETNFSGKPEVEKKLIQTQPIHEQLDGIPHERLICPDCKIIYERGNSCVRCGLALVAETQAREQEKLKGPDSHELKMKKCKKAKML